MSVRQSKSRPQSAAKQKQTRRLACEQLESRWVLSSVPLAPVAIDDSFATVEDATVSANVLTNGSGADLPAKSGQALRVAEVNGQAIGNGTSLSLPSGASLLVAADGSFTYDPTYAASLQALDEGQFASDQFTYIATPQFSGLYVFGDSLSDQGQLFTLTGGAFPPDPPYFEGRFSDGPVWIETAAPRLGLSSSLGNNFSVGGASTGVANYNEGLVAPDLPGVTDELNGFLQHLGGQAADPNALYVVWAGSNDFFLPFTDPVPVITQAVTNVTTIVGTLEAVGAQHVLVMNLPDLGLTPYGLSTPGLGPQLTALTEAFNDSLTAALDAYGIPVTQIDVFSRFQEVVNNPAAFGLSNVTTASFDGTGIVADPATSLFWDSVHPTAAGHALIADLVFEELSDEATATINVAGVTTSPALHVQNLTGASAGKLRLQLSATDQAANDQAAGFMYLVNWGDGSSPLAISAGSELELTHSFPANSVAKITIEAIDQDGDSSGVLREALVWGTARADVIALQTVFNGQTQISRNSKLLSSLPAGSVDRIVAFGLGGTDLLSAGNFAGAVEFDGGNQADLLLGGSGDDLLRGGRGNDVIFGGPGNDQLWGGDGIDLLIGGLGEDQLFDSAWELLLFGSSDDPALARSLWNKSKHK